MLWNMLTNSNANTPSGSGGSLLIMAIFIAIIVVFMIFNSRAQKKRQKETVEMLNALKPGNKVKTIGGICGIVVEICPEDNTFVLETGSEASGKSYIKFDKQAVYQTDAVVEKTPVQEELEKEKREMEQRKKDEE